MPDTLDPGSIKTVVCPYCSCKAPLVSGLEVYPHRRDLWPKRFYLCKPCDAWVGCHPPSTAEGGGQGDGTVPMGRLANAELRLAKQAAHAAFDPLWTGAKTGRGKARRAAYKLLAERLGIHVNDCHIGMFDVAQCARVVEVCLLLRKEPRHDHRLTETREPVRPPA